MTLELGFSALLVYMLVFVRFAGMFLTNPFFSRQGVPVAARIGIVLFMTLLIAPMQPVEPVLALSGFEYSLAAVRELLVGIVYGFIFSLFYNFLHLAGDLIDTDIGLSMAKTFDPTSSIQSSITGYMFLMLFALYFFATGSHLALIRMFADSFTLIPLGASGISTNIFGFIIELFSSIYMLVLRLVAPFMVASVILQASLGVLMKFIPQITVFVINFQMRILLGLLMLFLFAPFVGAFIDDYITILFDNLSGAINVLATGSV